MVFGKSKYDKEFDKNIKNLWSWINYLKKERDIISKNNDWFINEIGKLNKENKAQDVYDKQVAESLRTLDSKTNNVLELTKQVKDLQGTLANLQQQIATLQQTSHAHQATET